MDKEEIKRIFFELLNEDEEFQRKLTDFILNAVSGKFVERVTQDEPAEVPTDEPKAMQETATEEFARNIAKLTSERDGLKTERDKLNGQLTDKQNSIDDLNGQLRDKQNSINDLNGQLRDKQKSIDDLNGQLRDKQNSINDLNGQLRDKQNSINDLNGQLRDKQKSIDDLNGQLRDKQNSINDLNGQLRDKQNSINDLNGQLRDKQNSINDLTGQLRDKQNSIDDLNRQLDERFSDGWEIYKTFVQLDEETRGNVNLRSESFKSFICSGAQMKNLDGIWEATLDSKREGKSSDADILWKVFKYCVTLVNAAQGKPIIEMLKTQLGDRYDLDKHSTSGTNSSTQGVVREINLVGYRNNYNGKIRKSNVRVG